MSYNCGQGHSRSTIELLLLPEDAHSTYFAQLVSLGNLSPGLHVTDVLNLRTCLNILNGVPGEELEIHF